MFFEVTQIRDKYGEKDRTQLINADMIETVFESKTPTHRTLLFIKDDPVPYEIREPYDFFRKSLDIKVYRDE